MKRLTEQILAHAEKLPEGTPIAAKGLLHLGTRAGVNRALSRLAKRGELLRPERGIYFCPVKSRFGTHPPSVGLAIKALAEQRGETVVPNGCAAANWLRLTTQVPIRLVYLTSGRSRTLTFGKQKVELLHAPSWQLSFGNRPAGKAIRALDWLGPEHAEKALKKLKKTLPSAEFKDMVAAAPQLPTWLAEKIAGAVTDV
ncbi:MAG: type IV toxin-antitoxin system AbiEi family antitoxin domain-containing protein [Gammaproteobacteria bacterium AqS3]|nr:type IV toxin-antitoxin system AbiEi family antitoxin domain-containing protein [Gammaproteobacteria bacterium AqS3]